MENENLLETIFTDAKRDFLRIFPYAIGLLLLIVLMLQCQENQAILSRNEQNEKIKNDTIKYFNNKIGTLTASVGTAQYTANEYKQQVLNTNKKLEKVTSEFNKLSSIQQYHVKATIDTVFVPFEKPIVFDNAIDTTHTFLRSGKLEKDWFSFNYKIDNSGFTIDSTAANIDIISVTGFKKKWFLGRSTAVTDVTSPTKGVAITDLKSAQIVVPKKFYETNLFLIGTGFVLRSLIPFSF